jgi:CubicO group peptidase (beta-lactamase class C family)
MRRISLCFCLLYSVCIVHAFQASTSYNLSIQAQDSVTIKGHFIWKDSSITGYPPNVKIISIVNPHEQFIQQVDSMGVFEKTLPYGKYIISPELNYHWMGEEFIRINDKKSTLEINANTASNNEITISLDTVSWPKKNFKSGILNATSKIDYKAIDQFMLERMEFFEIPGATLSLIKDNKVIYSQTYGVTNSKTKHPVTSKTLFEAGSITKLVFAFAVMRLYEKGKIDLDKPLYQYSPSPDIADERYRLMTARHVLSHQSGLSNWPKKDADGKFKLNFTPGTQYGYSGQAYEYLKEVIESITSKSIDVVLREEVLVPLRLNDMHFNGNDAIVKYGANGHKKYIPSDILLAKKTMVAYTLQTTSEALAKFAIALNERKGLKKETYDELFKVHSKRDDGTEWGLGVRIEKTSAGISYGHSGSTDRGFISNLVFYKNSGLGFTILTNSQMGGWLSLPLLNEYLILGNSKADTVW